MSTDLVSKLRADAEEWNEADPGTAYLEREAANVIERLASENAVHAAITRALAEAGVRQEVLIGMCIEVGLEAYRDAITGATS